jgi:hypothetical protein
MPSVTMMPGIGFLRSSYFMHMCVHSHIQLSLIFSVSKKAKAVPLLTMKVLMGRGGIAPTHSRPRH